VKSTAVYARISLDRDGDAEGVERQVADAQALAETRGWTVAETFIDNDRSAYNGKARPEWNRLLGALRAGTVDTVIAWSSDRLYRRTRDQLDLMEAVRLAGGMIATCKDGDIDPASAEGRMRMGILANVAEFESARKAERVARAAEQRAASGRPHGRPSFGWKGDTAGEWIVDHDAAMLIREAAKRVVIGESVGSIVADWNDQGIRTPAGAKDWSHQTLRKLLRRPANAGLRVHRDRIAGPATWPAILDVETWEAVVSRLDGRGQRRPRRYLLTGVVVCGADGARMVGHAAKMAGYECVKCARRITSERLDDVVTETVLAKLSTPRLVERLARARSDVKEADALRDLGQADARLSEIATEYGRGDLELMEYRAARAAAQERRSEAERRLSSRRGSRVLSDALTVAEDSRAVWERQAIPWRRELIRAVVDRIEIGGSTKPAWEPERVQLVWRTG
jgi:site-specific DNA recombinase